MTSNFSRIKETYYALVEETTSPAEGVFLWANFVLKSIISEVALYSSYKRLREKIRSMLRELDELYDKILGVMERTTGPGQSPASVGARTALFTIEPNLLRGTRNHRHHHRP